MFAEYLDKSARNIALGRACDDDSIDENSDLSFLGHLNDENSLCDHRGKTLSNILGEEATMTIDRFDNNTEEVVFSHPSTAVVSNNSLAFL